MDESSYLDPAALQAQCDGAIQVLESDKEAIYILGNSLDSFINDGEIQGASFAAMKQQISDYKTVLQAIVTAHESDKMDFEALKGAAVGEVLDGSKIIPNKKKAKESQEECERRAEEFRNMASSCPMECSWMSDIFKGWAHFYSGLAEIERGLYEKWKEKEETYDAIEAATSGLFSASGGMRAAIDSALSEINGAFRVAEGRFEIDRRAPWRGEIGTAKSSLVKKQLNLMGIEPERVQELTDMGFTYDGLWGYRLMCQNEQDKKFYIQILSGTEENYIKAFQINPYDLNDGMTIFMADYSCKLLEWDENGDSVQPQNEQLMLFNNALLASETEYVDSTGTVLSIMYRDIYMKKLHAGSAYLLEQRVNMLGAMDTQSVYYGKLYHEYEKERSMLLLWSTEDALIGRLKNCDNREDFELSISDLIFDCGAAKFSFNHFSQTNGGMLKEIVQTSLMMSGDDVMDEIDLEFAESLHQGKADVVPKYLRSLVWDGLVIGAGMVAPELAIPASLASMYFQGSPGTVSGLDSLSESELGKLGIKTGNLVVKNAVSAGMDYFKYEEALEQANWEAYIKWFGMGGKYQIIGEDGVLSGRGITFAGVYNPNVIRQIHVWEEHGLDWIDWQQQMGDETSSVEDMSKIIGNSKYDKEIEDNCQLLLNGEKGMLDSMTMVDFENAVNTINENASLNESVRDQFKAAVKEGDKYE